MAGLVRQELPVSCMVVQEEGSEAVLESSVNGSLLQSDLMVLWLLQKD
jgi:hypothetical protein